MGNEVQQEEILRAQREANKTMLKNAGKDAFTHLHGAQPAGGDISDVLRQMGTQHADATVHLFASTLTLSAAILHVSKDAGKSIVGQYIIHKKYQRIKSVFKEETAGLEKQYFKGTVLNNVIKLHKQYENFKTEMEKMKEKSSEAVNKLQSDMGSKRTEKGNVDKELSEVEEKIKNIDGKVPEGLTKQKEELEKKHNNLAEGILEDKKLISQHKGIVSNSNLFGSISFKSFVHGVKSKKLCSQLSSVRVFRDSKPVQSMTANLSDKDTVNTASYIIEIMNSPGKSFQMPVYNFAGTRVENTVPLSFKNVDLYNIKSIQPAVETVKKNMKEIDHKIQSEIKYHPEIEMDIKDGLLSSKVLREAVQKDGVIQNKLIFKVNDTFKKNDIHMIAIPVAKIVDGIPRFSIALYHIGKGKCSEPVLKEAQKIVGKIVERSLGKSYAGIKGKLGSLQTEKANTLQGREGEYQRTR